MSKKNSEIKPKKFKKSEFKIKKDSRSGMLVLSGPKFTKEDIKESFPEDSEDRVAIVMRRSVGL